MAKKQKDYISNFLFSLDHSIQTANLSGIESYLKRKFSCLQILSIPFSYQKLKKIQNELTRPARGVLAVSG